MPVFEREGQAGSAADAPDTIEQPVIEALTDG
jgi:hypothetical protein